MGTFYRRLMRTFLTYRLVAVLLLAASVISTAPAMGEEPGTTTGKKFNSARLFQWLDADKDGQIRKDELRKLATLARRKCGNRLEVFDRLFEWLDADRNGQLSEGEFKGLQESRGRNNHSAPARKVSDSNKPPCISIPIADQPGHEHSARGISRQSGYDFSSIDRFMEKNKTRYDGGAGLILINDNQILYRKAFGNFTPETVVPIASASKWISACVILTLVDEGTLNLDDRESRYLPEFNGKKGTITIRQMFSHTHGLPDTPAYHRNTHLMMPEAVRLISELEPVAAPGTTLYYSGTGMQIAGRIAEIATGKQWAQIFQEKLGLPCELKYTDYYAFGTTKNPNVAGSVQTCLDDYGTIVMMLLGKGLFNGRRVLSEHAVSEMFSNQTGNVPIVRTPFKSFRDLDPASPSWRYGIGCWLEKMDTETGYASRASSGGAFGCMPFVDYELGLAGVYLPCSRNIQRTSEGDFYNEATAVYFELKPIIEKVIKDRKNPL